MRTDFTIPKNFLSYVKCEILNVYKSNLLYTAVFMHKIKNRTTRHHFFKNLSSLAFSFVSNTLFIWELQETTN